MADYSEIRTRIIRVEVVDEHVDQLAIITVWRLSIFRTQNIKKIIYKMEQNIWPNQFRETGN